MSHLQAVLHNTMPLSAISSNELEALEEDLFERGFGMQIERSMSHDWDADDEAVYQRNQQAFDRVVAELKARDAAEAEAEAEHGQFEDGRHTLVG